MIAYRCEVGVLNMLLLYLLHRITVIHNWTQRSCSYILIIITFLFCHNKNQEIKTIKMVFTQRWLTFIFTVYQKEIKKKQPRILRGASKKIPLYWNRFSDVENWNKRIISCFHDIPKPTCIWRESGTAIKPMHADKHLSLITFLF